MSTLNPATTPQGNHSQSSTPPQPNRTSINMYTSNRRSARVVPSNSSASGRSSPVVAVARAQKTKRSSHADNHAGSNRPSALASTRHNSLRWANSASPSASSAASGPNPYNPQLRGLGSMSTKSRLSRNSPAVSQVGSPSWSMASTVMSSAGSSAKSDGDEHVWEDATGDKGKPSWMDVAVIVLMLGVIVVSLVLPYLAWQDAVSDQDAQRDAHFGNVVAEHHQALVSTMESTRARLSQYGVFCQLGCTADNFEVFAAAEDEYFVSYAPIVAHADRAQFEHDVHDEVTASLNDTALAAQVPRNITSFVISDGIIVGFEVSPPKSRYVPIQYAHPVSPSLVMLDLLSEPERERTFNRSIAANSPTLSRRVLVYTSVGPYAATHLYHVTRDPVDNSPSAMVSLTLFWVVLVPNAMQFASPNSLRVLIFDVTGDGGDQTGCAFPLMFDGTQDASGAWSQTRVWNSECRGSESAVVDYLDTIDDGSYETRRLQTSGNTYLVAYFKGPDFADDSAPLSRTLFMYVIALACVAVAQIAMVLARATHLIRRLAKSREAIVSMHRSTKTFFSFITHELRNPLFAVLGTSGALHDRVVETGGDEEALDMVASIETASDRMSSIINDVLSMRKLEEGKLELEHLVFSLEQVAREMLTTFGTRAAQGGIDFVVEVSPNVPDSLIGDDGRLVQVISNLVSNSIKFTPRGGEVKVSVRRAEVQMDHDLATLHASHADESRADADVVTLEFVVSDTGCGIPPAALPHLFTPYKQASAAVSRNHGGTGLGLAIVRMLVQCMGGEVTVSSVQSKGSDFIVRIPFEAVITERESDSRGPVIISQRSSNKRVEEDTQVQPMVDAMAVRQTAKLSVPTGSILIVDDLPMNLRVLTRMIKNAMPKVTVLQATNGREAIDLMLLHKKRFLLVLMDVMMPVMDGREATRELRARGIRVPIIAVSGGGEPEELALNQAAGFTSTALKPLKRSQLLGLVQKHCKRL